MSILKPDIITAEVRLRSEQALAEIHKLTKDTGHWRTECRNISNELRELEKQGKKNTSEYDNLQKALKQVEAKIRANGRAILEWEGKVHKSYKTTGQLSKEIKKLRRELSNTSRSAEPERYKQLAKQLQAAERAFAEANRSSRGFMTSLLSMDRMAETIKGFFLGIGLVIMQNVVGAFKDAFNIIVDFEKENSRLAGILGTTRDGVKNLEKAARELGATTCYSAAQVTQLQIELAKLGFGEEQILKMESAVLKFAKATGTGLDSAAAFAGAALRIFGKDASETEEVLATFAVATTKTALDFQKLESSLSTVGPVANAFGLSIEDTTALLGQLANAGFDASSAATATRNIILKLCDANGDLAKALGAPVKTADDLAAGLQKLNAQGIDLAAALDLTDKRSVAAFSTFLEGADTLTELRDSITGVVGEFNAMSDTMGDNVAGAMAGLHSASEELILKLGSGLTPAIKGIIKALTSFVQGIGDAIEFIKKNADIIVSLLGIMAYYRAALILQAKLDKEGRKAILGKIAALKAEKLSVDALKSSWQKLNSTMKANLFAIISTLVLAAAAALAVYIRRAGEATSARKALNTAEDTAASNYAKQKANIDALVTAAKNENTALETRLKAVDKLNEIIPGYNANIDRTTGKYRSSTKALNEYLGSLEKKLRYEATQEEYKKLIAEEERLRREKLKAYEREKEERRTNQSAGSAGLPTGSVNYTGAVSEVWDDTGRKARQARAEWEKAKKAREELEDYIEEGLKSGKMTATVEVDVEVKSGPEGNTPGGSIEKTVTEKVEKVRKIIEAATAEAEAEHQARLLDILQKKDSVSETKYVIKTSEEMVRYCGELKTSLDELSKNADNTNTELLSKITEEIGKADANIVKARQEINAAMTKESERGHAERLRAIEAGLEAENLVYQKRLNEREITAGESEILRMRAERGAHSERLAELKRYLGEVEASETMTAEQRRKRIAELERDISSAQSQVLTDTGRWQEKLRELMEDRTSAAGIMSAYDMRRADIEATYREMIKAVGEGTEEAVALEREKNRRTAALDYERLEETYRLEELTGISWAREYDRELAQLENYHRQGMVSEAAFQKRRVQLAMENAHRYFSYFAGLSESAFSEIQAAEIAASDAKFDVLIRQAENAGEETTAIEQEKENKKLEIQKKYADVNFAIRISEIIADTAVAIMQAFAQLGPVGGAVAAALLSATGVAQAAAAKAERDKVRQLEPGSTSSSGSSQGATGSSAPMKRALTGYSEGGYTGDGERLEVAGVVHRGEYVVPKRIMGDARVIDAVGMIEAIRRNRGAVQPPADPRGAGLPGYSDGGPVGSVRIDTGELTAAVEGLKEATRGIRAYVVYKDIERAGREIDRARAPFTRNR